MSKYDLLNNIFIKDISDIITDYHLPIIDLRKDILWKLDCVLHYVFGLEHDDIFECNMPLAYNSFFSYIYLYIDDNRCSVFSKQDFICGLNFWIINGEIEIPNVYTIDFKKKYHDLKNSKQVRMKINKIIHKNKYSIIYTDNVIFEIDDIRLITIQYM